MFRNLSIPDHCRPFHLLTVPRRFFILFVLHICLIDYFFSNVVYVVVFTYLLIYRIHLFAYKVCYYLTVRIVVSHLFLSFRDDCIHQLSFSWRSSLLSNLLNISANEISVQAFSCALQIHIQNTTSSLTRYLLYSKRSSTSKSTHLSLASHKRDIG